MLEITKSNRGKIGNVICIDGFLRCKKQSTAFKRIKKELSQSLLSGWEDTITECLENGCFQAMSWCKTDGYNWHYCFEENSNGFYFELTVNELIL